MPKRHTYKDGSVLDLDDDIDIDDLPEGEDDLSDDEFADLLARVEAEEKDSAPVPELDERAGDFG